MNIFVYVRLLVYKYTVIAVCLISLVRFLFVLWKKRFFTKFKLSMFICTFGTKTGNFRSVGLYANT